MLFIRLQFLWGCFFLVSCFRCSVYSIRLNRKRQQLHYNKNVIYVKQSNIVTLSSLLARCFARGSQFFTLFIYQLFLGSVGAFQPKKMILSIKNN